MIRRILSLSFLLLFLSKSAYGQLTAKEAFMHLPQEVVPTLDETMKKSLLETYSQEGRKAVSVVKNSLGGSMQLKDLSFSYLQMLLDPMVELQLKVFPGTNHEPLICVIMTSLVVPQQSVVKFYDGRWREVPGSGRFALPSPTEFLKDPKQGEQTLVKSALAECGLMTYRATLHPQDNTLTLRLTCFDDKIAQKKFAHIRPLFDPKGLSMEWKEDHFSSKRKSPK